jgi:hypothetical protein
LAALKLKAQDVMMSSWLHLLVAGRAGQMSDYAHADYMRFIFLHQVSPPLNDASGLGGGG